MAIPAHLQVHADRIRAAGKRTLAAAWELGQRLLDARRAARHGEWGRFLEDLGIPESTARRCMSVADQMKNLPDAERGKLTTIGALLEGPAPAPGIGGVSDSGGPDGGLQIGHAADFDTLVGYAAPVDFRAFDALVERLPPDTFFDGLAGFVQDERRWKIGGQEYRTHPALAILPEPDRRTVERMSESIEEIGQLSPVVVDTRTRTLVDGRGRILACALAGVPVKWVCLPPHESATAMVWRSNVLRRSLTEEQRSRVLAQLEDLRV